MYDIRENNASEVIEMNKMENRIIKVGPEINIESVNQIENHSSLICLKCDKKVKLN